MLHALAQRGERRATEDEREDHRDLQPTRLRAFKPLP
jgi:hypothetical protein